jgi:intracellular multiplication protein IcmE
MGDIIFAVIDTSINSDEPGPILASVVSGPLKGSKLIGSFNLPSNSDKMVITFNSLSIPGAPKTVSISAFAIDPNTARTALSSETDHHYLSRYGALFASTFLEGFGNAFQSADTTITVGGTGGTTDTTVQNGIGRSALENAVIGLANVGKAWGQVAQQNMSRPTTVQVFSGTGVGILFTQDLTI